jgi:hypothetical protein
MLCLLALVGALQLGYWVYALETAEARLEEAHQQFLQARKNCCAGAPGRAWHDDCTLQLVTTLTGGERAGGPQDCGRSPVDTD